jgi:hypothetical protein
VERVYLNWQSILQNNVLALGTLSDLTKKNSILCHGTQGSQGSFCTYFIYLGWQNSVTGDCSGVFAVCFANLNNSFKVHKN